jgi:hypothetical protein
MDIDTMVRAANPTMKIAQRLLLQVFLDVAADDREDLGERTLLDVARRLEAAGYEGFRAALEIGLRIDGGGELPGDRAILEAWRREHF